MRTRWPGEFDAVALYAAMDAERARRGLTWTAVAREMSEKSQLAVQRGRHPISPSTITGMARRGDTTCQHALFFLRWVGRSPESFIDASRTRESEWPAVNTGQRLRWNLPLLYNALNRRRGELGLSWAAAARALRCSESQLTGIRTAKYAIGMTLAMRITQWLEEPASAFVYAAGW